MIPDITPEQLLAEIERSYANEENWPDADVLYVQGWNDALSLVKTMILFEAPGDSVPLL